MVVTIFACEFPGGNPFDDEDWGDNIENNDSIPSLDDILPNDSILGGDDILPNDSILGGDDILPNDSIPGGEDILPNDSIVSPGNFHNGYEWVDLGLSVKWATCNVGATKPEEYGGYYAWGETEEKSNYSWDTYKYSYFENDNWLVSKYCLHNDCGWVDNKTTLDASDDVACVKWGGSWRMPTREEQQELSDRCQWEADVLNGVNGIRATGPNGNSIFLPAAGIRNGDKLRNEGTRGYFWSASLADFECSFGWFFFFFDFAHYCFDNGYYRCHGYSVRPVCE